MFAKIKKNYFLLISTFLILYFFFNLLDGERGLFSYIKKKEILIDNFIEPGDIIFHNQKINHGVNENIIFLEDVWKDKIKKEYVKIKIMEDDPACIIYTSGTSGVPKGVILTHKSILSNLIGSLNIFKNINFNNERYISFLPLSHQLF